MSRDRWAYPITSNGQLARDIAQQLKHFAQYDHRRTWPLSELTNYVLAHSTVFTFRTAVGEWLSQMINDGLLRLESCIGWPGCGPKKPRGFPPNIGSHGRRATLRKDYEENWKRLIEHRNESHYRIMFDQLDVWAVGISLAEGQGDDEHVPGTDW